MDTKFPTIPTYRTEKATGTLPQTTQGVLFTISGRVRLIDIIGEVTTQIGAGANNAKLISNPTVGADVDICAQLDIDGDVVGTMYSITGTLADAMIATTSGAFRSQVSAVTLAAGTLDLYCSASKTGSVKWTVVYQPIDSTAKIV